jgi:hypothetical protein
MSGSDFELGPLDEVIGGNPLVNRDQLEQGQRAVAALRQAGVSGPSYKIESPYERTGTSEPRAIVEDEGSSIIPPRC